MKPAQPVSSRSSVALPSKPSRTLVQVSTVRPATFPAVEGRNIGVPPLSLNSQSSCAGCQANFTNPGLLTAAAHAAGDWCETRPGPVPKSVTPEACAKNSSRERGSTGEPAVHTCSR